MRAMIFNVVFGGKDSSSNLTNIIIKKIWMDVETGDRIVMKY